MAPRAGLTLLMLISIQSHVCSAQGSGIVSTQHWSERTGQITVDVTVGLQAPCALTDWSVVLFFSEPVLSFEAWEADGGSSCVSYYMCQVTNRYPKPYLQGSTLTFNFHVKFAASFEPQISAGWGPSVCGGPAPPPPPTPSPTPTPTPTPTTTTTTATTTTTPAAPSNAPAPGTTGGVVVKHSWLEGGDRKVDAEVRLQAPCALGSFSVVLSFSRPAFTFETWNANNGDSCVSNQVCQLTNRYQVSYTQGAMVTFTFQAKFSGGALPQISAGWGSVCGGNPPPITPAPGTPSPATPATATPAPATPAPGTAAPAPGTPAPSGIYDYKDVLHKSMLFYEAQRSGRLPPTNRVPWRGDSALFDGQDSGLDLTGGWYDAGDGVKFNFPMASSVTLLAWGMLRYKEAYVQAGEWQNALDCIKWPLDYLIKCHPVPNVLYGQVGNGRLDHMTWTRPEDLLGIRPSYKLTTSSPGSDLAAETAAAMTAGHLVFKDINPVYADSLLRHAKELYSFAKTYRGKYSDSIPDAAEFYRSSQYEDELAWAAVWLSKATGEAVYLSEAQTFLDQLSTPAELSWDDKKIVASLLVYEANPGHTKSRNNINSFVNNWLNSVPRTPRGLAWLRQWGPNRYAANAAFCLQVAADMGIQPARARTFARDQVDYMLGDGGRSFVVGFGTNPPTRPHHRASSCPARPAPCSWTDFNSPNPNPFTLSGALVGGPDINDQYADDRSDYIKNEVACDYNAGFQSAVAGIFQSMLP